MEGARNKSEAPADRKYKPGDAGFPPQSMNVEKVEPEAPE